MMILARIQMYPDNLNMREVMKFKVNFDEFGLPSMSCSPGQSSTHMTEKNIHLDLSRFILHIVDSLSPGLIQLPTELKLEILKKMSVQSIVEMSRVNNEFRRLIYYEGDTLWRHLCRRDFKLTLINRNVHRTWLELYKDHYMKYLADLMRNNRALPPTPIFPALPPAPNILPIAWIPEELEPLFPLEGIDDRNVGNQLLNRRGSLESLNNIIL